MSLPQEEEKIYDVISKALLSLCEQKPNDPVDFLSRKMLELIGEDPNKAIRKKENLVEDKANDEVVISPDKIAIQNLQKDFYQYYKIIERISVNNYIIEDLKLGETNGRKCARIIDKSLNQNKILLSDRTITTLVKLTHPNLVRVIEILEDDKYFYIIHDYCPGKDIMTYLLRNRDKCSESLFRKALTQILSALSYLHRSGVIYKNVCPSKILVNNEEFDPLDIQIKLSDLINNTESFSKKSYIYKGYDNIIQNPLYIAPEYIEKKYNHKVDIWGVGIIAYMLFVGEPPFKGTKNEIIYQISNGKIEYPPNLSETKKNLLKKMLCKNPNDRYEASDLLKEDYFQVEGNDGEPGSEEPEKDKEFYNVVNSMCNFAVGKTLRKSVISYIIARKLYTEKDTKIRKMFESIDKDHSGFIDKKEILEIYKKYFPGTTEQQYKIINGFLETADVGNKGKIDYAEFLTTMNLGNKDIGKKTLKEIFDYYDYNKNGIIEASDIKEIFEDTGISDKEIHQMLDDVDLNEDRTLTFEEFYNLITSSF